MKKIIFLTFILSSLVALNAQQGQSSINNTAMPFLLINADARSGGMGDVGVATSPDAFSIFHNPAKITFNRTHTSASLNYTPWLRNLANDIFVGGGSYINRFRENSAWGVDIKYFSLGKVDLRSDQAQDTGTENPSEFAITGTYALKLSETFSMGVGLKYINSNYKINSANTNLNAVNSFAVDVSGYYQSEERNYGNFNGRYRLGFNITNIGPKVDYTPGVLNFIPTNLKLGGGFDFILDNLNIIGVHTEFTKLLVPANPTSDEGWIGGMFTSFGDSQEFKEITWALGAEYKYNNAFAFRSGYFHESEQRGNRQFFTLGAGFKMDSFSLDLSYLINTASANNPLENTLRFSLAFDFGEVFNDY